MMNHALTTTSHATYQPTSARRPSAGRMTALATLIILLWLWSWLPQLLDLNIIGRQMVYFKESPERSSQAEAAYRLVVSSIFIVSVLLLLPSLRESSSRRLGLSFLMLVLWSALHLRYVVDGGRNNEVLLGLLVLVAFARNAEHLAGCLHVLRWLVFLTAGVSLCLALVSPETYLTAAGDRIVNEKALMGTRLLTGLFPTSNQLGVALASGAVLCLGFQRRILRQLALATVLVALVFASSRTALGAGVAIVTFHVWLHFNPRINRARFWVYVSMAALAVAAILPALTSDRTLFTNRVAIWQDVIGYWLGGHFWLGGGTMILREVSDLTLKIGAIAGTGHNVFITLIAVGGGLALLMTTAVLLLAVQGAYNQFCQTPLLLSCLAAVYLLCALEDPFRGFIVAPTSFITLPVLVMSLSSSRTERS